MRFKSAWSLAVMLVPWLWFTECAEASSFQGLGHLGGGNSRALGVSADGQVVVGFSNTGVRNEAFRWMAGSGMVGLGVLSSGSSAANAVSGDGSVIVGRSGNGANDLAFRWTAGGGMQSLGVLSDGRSEAFDVSADGRVIVGVSGKEAGSCSNLTGPPCSPPPPPGTEQAFRWTALTGMVGLGTLPLGAANGSLARSVSADGSVVAGEAFAYQLVCFPQLGGSCVFLQSGRAFRWTGTSGLENIGGTQATATVSGMAADGSVFVGRSGSAAALWTATSGFVSLGLNGNASDASANGTAIVGGSDNSGGAFFWRQQPAFLKTMLIQLFGQALAGWTLSTATGISDDGRTIVGWGTNPFGQEEGWIARLDTLPAPAELADLPPSSSPNALLSAVLPLSRSMVVGTVATIFASILNQGRVPAIGCRIAPATQIPAVLDYNATNTATNVPIGPQNTPFDIPAGGAQSFVIGFTATEPFPPADVRLAFDCVNTPSAAPSHSGINTVLLSASTTPTTDIVALGATIGNSGVVDIPGVDGAGLFAVATVNAGASGLITVSADTGSLNLPVSIALCQTNPTTSVCLDPPAGNVTTQIGAGATPTFAIFVAGTGTVLPFDPANNRVFVHFKDGNGATRGSTSVAVRTQ